jgi:hypothetical protein
MPMAWLELPIAVVNPMGGGDISEFPRERSETERFRNLPWQKLTSLGRPSLQCECLDIRKMRILVKAFPERQDQCVEDPPANETKPKERQTEERVGFCCLTAGHLIATT